MFWSISISIVSLCTFLQINLARPVLAAVFILAQDCFGLSDLALSDVLRCKSIDLQVLAASSLIIQHWFGLPPIYIALYVSLNKYVDLLYVWHSSFELGIDLLYIYSKLRIV